MSESNSTVETEKPLEESSSTEAVKASTQTKVSWRDFMKTRFAEIKATDASLTPPNILKKISEEWREMPADSKLRNSGNADRKRKKSSATASAVAAGEETVTDDEDAESGETEADKKRAKPVSFGSRHYMLQTLEAFNGTPDKLSIYSTAGQIMKKQNSGCHRESYVLPITQSNRSVILKAIRAADAQIQRGEISDLYQALQVGFSIPFSVFRHRA